MTVHECFNQRLNRDVQETKEETLETHLCPTVERLVMAHEEIRLPEVLGLICVKR
jgi:hypothetical protein